MLNSHKVRALHPAMLLPLMISLCFAQQGKRAADLVLRGGNIVTLDTAKPLAQALAVRGDSIGAVGTDAEIQAYIGPATRIIDLNGKLAIPGFIESHAHFMGVGQAKMSLDLTQASSWDEIVSLVAQAAEKAQSGEWIVGRGWHQEKWSRKPEPNVEGFPIHDSLSKVSPENPVLLTHASGHAAYANAKAMQLAGITRETRNPPGGEILRDAHGDPIGVFRETASSLVGGALSASLSKRTPEQVRAAERKEIELAIRECLSKGITTFHDAGASFKTVDLYRELAQHDQLGLRLYVMLQESNDRLARNADKYRIVNFGNKHLTVRAIKRLIDGALGPRGAWLLEPYRDLPGSTGLNTTSVDSLSETAKIAMEHGLQLCTHAIGDRANREILDVYEAAFRANPAAKNLRWRIEHAQHISAADIPRFGALGVIAAMQGIHCTSDAPYVLARLGAQRAENGAYAWQQLMKSGAVLSNGTDAPVEDVNPVACYYATVSRKLKDGSAFFPDQRMSREEALKSYTWNGAYAAFEEDIKGSLKTGMLADITILSKDILTIPEDEIPSAVVLCTIVGGRILYQK